MKQQLSWAQTLSGALDQWLSFDGKATIERVLSCGTWGYGCFSLGKDEEVPEYL